jgi:hypothetical protein
MIKTDTALSNVVSDLQQIELEETKAIEYLEAKQEKEKNDIHLSFRQRKAIRVYEYSKVEKCYASKLAAKWGRRKSEINELKRLGEKLSDPSQGVTGVARAKLEGVKQSVARMGMQEMQNVSMIMTDEMRQNAISTNPYLSDDINAIDEYVVKQLVKALQTLIIIGNRGSTELREKLDRALQDFITTLSE